MAPPKPSKKAAAVTTTAPPVKEAPIDYEEMQENELSVLSSIFGDDFQDVVTQGAWQKTTDRSFRLTVRSTDRELFVVLSVRFTATYPKSPPIIEVIRGLDELHARTVTRIRNILDETPAQLLGDSMIWSIADDIKDALEDASQARKQNTLPSLDEERVNAEEVAAQLAKQAAEADALMQSKIEAEERRELDRQVKEEALRLEKRTLRNSITQPQELPPPTPEILSFGHTARVRVQGTLRDFTQVFISGSLTHNLSKEIVLLGRPLATVPGGDVPVVTVTRRKVKKPKSVAWQLEQLMVDITQLNHTNLLNVLASRVTITNEAEFESLMCCEYAEGGPMYDLLSICDQLPQPKAQQFTRELLEGLEYLHGNGVLHGYLNLRSIYLTSGPNPSPKLACFGYLGLIGVEDDTLPNKWRAPAEILKSKAADIWQLGAVVAQMFFGIATPDEYDSPKLLRARPDISDAMLVFLDKVFAAKKTGNCFDLLRTELLRTDEPVLRANLGSRVENQSTTPRPRSRHNSSNIPEPTGSSHYQKAFREIRQLGKGGFGVVAEVVAKTDGSRYAVKKIQVRGSQLDDALRETSLISRVNHPYVVQYKTSWVGEGEKSSAVDDSESNSGSYSEDEGESEAGILHSPSYAAAGLDFISNDHAHLDSPDEYEADQDGEDDSFDPFDRDGTYENGTEEEETGICEDSESTSESSKTAPRKWLPSSSRPARTLYIQMELCNQQTLGSLIDGGISEDHSWRLIRQITDGLAAIHVVGIIHRDLKPQNIFIDASGNPKIGDFGLATITDFQDPDDATESSSTNKSIGTALYMAPELRTGSTVQQSSKVDMYSLGIIFFEMCNKFGTKMERITELQQVRQKDHALPAIFLPDSEKAKQGNIIKRLISHTPSERPSSADLLQELPVQIEAEATRKVLSEMKDRDSAIYRQMMTDLFSHSGSGARHAAKGSLWDTRAAKMPEKAVNIRLRNIVRGTLETIFRRHGAEEIRRDFIFPSAVKKHYPTKPNVMQLMDASGNLLQLPYDLILPYARQLARQKAATRCTFTFSGAYRNMAGPPKASVEADFDIVNNKDDDDDTALNDAEAIKVVDEALTELPQFVAQKAVFYLSHGVLIDAILDACRVPLEKQFPVKMALERVGYQSNTKEISSWSNVDTDLRNMKLMGTTVDALKEYDFSLPPAKAFEKLSNLMSDAKPQVKTRCDTAIDELRHIVQCTKLFKIERKVVISPLSCHNAKFYATGLIFTAAVSNKNDKIPLASGGRYDSLIEQQNKPDPNLKQGAVGFQIGVDPIVKLLISSGVGKKSDNLKDTNQVQPLAKRCEVLLVTNGTEKVRDVALGLLTNLWAADIKAELSREHNSYESQEYSLIAHLRHETATTVALTNPETGHGAEVPAGSVVNHIQQELRDMVSSRTRIPLLRVSSSHWGGDDQKADNVEVLRLERGGKKANRDDIVHAVRHAWEEKLDELKGGPILAIEARDPVLELVAATKLSDAETWRQATQNAGLNERSLMRALQEKLFALREQGARYIGVHSWLSKEGILYDLTA